MKSLFVIFLMCSLSSANSMGIGQLIELSCNPAADQYSKAFVVLDEMLIEKMKLTKDKDVVLKELDELANLLDSTADDNHKFYRNKIQEQKSDEGRLIYRHSAAASAYVGTIAKTLWFKNIFKNKDRYVRVIYEACESEMYSRARRN
jgi:hypothetical protein